MTPRKQQNIQEELALQEEIAEAQLTKAFEHQEKISELELLLSERMDDIDKYKQEAKQLRYQKEFVESQYFETQISLDQANERIIEQDQFIESLYEELKKQEQKNENQENKADTKRLLIETSANGWSELNRSTNSKLGNYIRRASKQGSGMSNFENKIKLSEPQR